jgi:hypothetical protein
MTKNDRILARLRDEIAEATDPHSRKIGESMLVLLTSVSEQSTDIPHLTERTGLPEEFISRIAARLRAAGLWTDDGLDTRGWWDEHDELLAHVLLSRALLGLGE